MLNEIKELILKATNVNIDINLQGDKNLTDLGIDSLMYMMIIVQIEETYDIQFDEEKMVEGNYDTIIKLANFVENEVK